jgi:hypothetical protein
VFYLNHCSKDTAQQDRPDFSFFLYQFYRPFFLDRFYPCNCIIPSSHLPHIYFTIISITTRLSSQWFSIPFTRIILLTALSKLSKMCSALRYNRHKCVFNLRHNCSRYVPKSPFLSRNSGRCTSPCVTTVTVSQLSQMFFTLRHTRPICLSPQSAHSQLSAKTVINVTALISANSPQSQQSARCFFHLGRRARGACICIYCVY